MSIELKEALVECVEYKGESIAFIIRAEKSVEETTFLTPEDYKKK